MACRRYSRCPLTSAKGSRSKETSVRASLSRGSTWGEQGTTGNGVTYMTVGMFAVHGTDSTRRRQPAQQHKDEETDSRQLFTWMALQREKPIWPAMPLRSKFIGAALSDLPGTARMGCPR